MAMFGAKGGSINGFTPPQPGIAGTAGLIGDVLTDTNTTKTRLDDNFNFAQQQYAAAHPAPMSVGGNVLQYDPTTGGVKTLYSAPPELDAFGKTLQAAGFTPGTADWQHQYALKAQNEVDPIHAYPTTDAAGNSGLLFKRPSELGAPQAPMAAPAGVTFTPRASGGAAPTMGPGGFPFYRPSH